LKPIFIFGFIYMIRRRLLPAILIFLMAISVAGIGYAQSSVKKKSKKELHNEKHEKKVARRQTKALEKAKRKELKKKEKQEHKKQKREQKRSRKKGGGKVIAGEATMLKQQVVLPHSQMKPRYRIDVLAHMYLDEVKNYKIPDKALPGIAFYEGVTIAADSLKKAGFKIDIYVHDVASAAESVDMLVRKNMLDSSDLIIGAVQSHDIPVLAEYAKNKKVNFISALSPADAGVRDNPFFTLLQPSLKSHCEWIVADVAKKFPGMKVGLLYRTSFAADSIAYKYLIGSAGDGTRFNQVLCNTLPRRKNLIGIFDTSKPNVIIVPVLDFSYADSLLNRVSHDFPETHFEVYGMPSWNSISNLRKEEAFPNLSINVTVPFNIDLSVPVVDYVNRVYKKDYAGRPTEYVYRGYEAMYWYANLLKQYGNIFNEKYSDNASAPFTKFEVKPQWDKNGQLLFNENTHIFVTKYEGGTYKTE